MLQVFESALDKAQIESVFSSQRSHIMSNALGLNPYGELNNNHNDQKNLYCRYSENQALMKSRQRQPGAAQNRLLSRMLLASMIIRRMVSFLSHSSDLS